MSASISSLPPDVADRLRAELTADELEHLAWCDQPVAELRARRALMFVLMGAVWTTLSLSWMLFALIGGVWFSLFGAPFVLVGVLLLLQPKFARRNARNSVFAITNERVVVIEATGVFGNVSVRSFLPGSLDVIERRDGRDGDGDLVFERREWVDSDGDRRVSEYGLFGVRNVREVERMVRQLVASRSSTRTRARAPE